MGLSASGHGGAGDATPLEDGVGTIPSCQKGRFRGSRSPGQPAPDHELIAERVLELPKSY